MNIAIVGGPGYIDRSFARSTAELYGMTGRNTGNLVFWYAFNYHVYASRREYHSFNITDRSVESINKCDALVFIFANHVSAATDLGHLVDKVEKINVPIIAFGLGAQSRLAEDIEKVPDGSLEFFRKVAEKTSKIGVRGEFTQSVLKRLGIDNTVVLGCVSNFIAGNLAKTIRNVEEWDRKTDSVGLNNDFIESVEPLHLMAARLFPRSSLDFIVQAPIELLHLARNESDSVDQAYRRRLDRVVKIFAKAGYSEREVLGRVYAFFDTRAWMEHVKRYDLTLGSRMHGNMASFQTGIPTVFIPHDSRTDELARTMALPRFELSECSDVAIPKDFFDKVDFDREKYFDTRSTLKKRYIDLLEAGGLQPTKFLQEI